VPESEVEFLRFARRFIHVKGRLRKCLSTSEVSRGLNARHIKQKHEDCICYPRLPKYWDVEHTLWSRSRISSRHPTDPPEVVRCRMAFETQALKGMVEEALRWKKSTAEDAG